MSIDFCTQKLDRVHNLYHNMVLENLKGGLFMLIGLIFLVAIVAIELAIIIWLLFLILNELAKLGHHKHPQSCF